MSILKIALLQIAPTGSLEGNLVKGITACRDAKAMGADIALFPEMWSCGYDICEPPAEEWLCKAILLNSEFLAKFQALAAELDMAIAVTLLEAYEPKPRNTMVLFDRFGERKLVYAKVHTCDFGAEKDLTPGDEFFVADLDTAQGIIKIGGMICYDREFPESARLLMLQGAEVVLVPNACPMEVNRLSQLRGRAFENMMAIATCNYPATVPDCNGGSSVFDGVAYLPHWQGFRDMCILQADESEGIFLSEIDLDLLREYRQCEVHGNAYRRPHLYGDLLNTAVQAPFIRDDKR